MAWHSAERKISGEIMSTSVFLKVVSQERSQEEMEKDLDTAILMFKNFEKRFSRFLSESELSVFNQSSGIVSVSPELAHLLTRAKSFWEQTEGIFDPSILPQLVEEGYGASFDSDCFGKSGECAKGQAELFSSMRVDLEKNIAEKPEGLKIDLGGMGKGYIVDRVAEFLAHTYKNCFVDAGGDMRAYGENKEEGYDFWAVSVEIPEEKEEDAPLILLRERAVATSGVGGRRWRSETGEEKHHLIDPRTGRSAKTDLFSVTVVDVSAQIAEVWAKTLCILGWEVGIQRAKEKKIAALFIGQDGEIAQSEYMENYVWKSP